MEMTYQRAVRFLPGLESIAQSNNLDSIHHEDMPKHIEGCVMENALMLARAALKEHDDNKEEQEEYKTIEVEGMCPDFTYKVLTSVDNLITACYDNNLIDEDQWLDMVSTVNCLMENMLDNF